MPPTGASDPAKRKLLPGNEVADVIQRWLVATGMAQESVIPKQHVADLIGDGYRFSEKIMLEQKPKA
jgi:hypothetical protein